MANTLAALPRYGLTLDRSIASTCRHGSATTLYGMSDFGGRWRLHARVMLHDLQDMHFYWLCAI